MEKLIYKITTGNNQEVMEISVFDSLRQITVGHNQRQDGEVVKLMYRKLQEIYQELPEREKYLVQIINVI